MSIDVFYGATYNRRSYNCAHFVVDVWRHVTGNDISEVMKGFLLPPSTRHAGQSLRKSFTRLPEPVEPCIVLMQRKGSAAHVGVWIDGKVFHLHDNGVELQPLSVVSIPFSKIGFYTCLSA